MILVTDDPAVYIEWHLTVLAWTIGAAIILTGVIGSVWAMWKAWHDPSTSYHQASIHGSTDG